MHTELEALRKRAEESLPAFPGDTERLMTVPAPTMLRLLDLLRAAAEPEAFNDSSYMAEQHAEALHFQAAELECGNPLCVACGDCQGHEAAEPEAKDCKHEGIGKPGCTTCDPRTFPRVSARCRCGAIVVNSATCHACGAP